MDIDEVATANFVQYVSGESNIVGFLSAKCENHRVESTSPIPRNHDGVIVRVVSINIIQNGFF